MNKAKALLLGLVVFWQAMVLILSYIIFRQFLPSIEASMVGYGFNIAVLWPLSSFVLYQVVKTKCLK